MAGEQIGLTGRVRCKVCGDKVLLRVGIAVRNRAGWVLLVRTPGTRDLATGRNLIAPEPKEGLGAAQFVSSGYELLGGRELLFRMRPTGAIPLRAGWFGQKWAATFRQGVVDAITTLVSHHP